MGFKIFVDNVKTAFKAGGKKSLSISEGYERGLQLNLSDLSQLTLSDVAQFFGSSVNWGEYSDSKLIGIYDSIPEVFSPIHQIAFRVASANFILKKSKDDSPVTDNDYINTLLTAPNPLQNFQELIYQAVTYKYVTGKNFMYANVPDPLRFDYKNILTLWNLFPQSVQPQTAPQIKWLSATKIEDIITSYQISDGQNFVPIKPEKVLYKQVHSLRQQDMKIRGRAPLWAANKPIQNLIKVYEARHVIYDKRGALGLLASKKSDASGLVPLTKDEKAEALEEWNKTYGLSGDKSNIAISSAPMDFIKIAMSIQELQPFEETLADACAIYAVLNVPRELMPQPKGSTYENQNQAEKGFYENVIIPEANSWAQSLTNWMRLKDAGFYLEANFDHVKVLQENLKEKASVDWRNNETYRVRFERGIITLNDWRTLCGLEPVVNKLYDKLMFEMAPIELETVKEVISIAIGSNSNSGNPNSDSNPGN